MQNGIPNIFIRKTLKQGILEKNHDRWLAFESTNLYKLNLQFNKDTIVIGIILFENEILRFATQFYYNIIEKLITQFQDSIYPISI